jgi:lipopolysaccharide transport system ATP-binding protein
MLKDGVLLQEPVFMPHEMSVHFAKTAAPPAFRFVARGGLSRWAVEDTGLKLCGFTIENSGGETNKVLAMTPVRFVLTLVAEEDGDFACRYGIAIFDYMGACRARIVSPGDSFSIRKGETRCAEMIFNPLQLGPGEYVLSLSVHNAGRIEDFGNAKRFDLLSRSFELIIEVSDSLAAFSADFFHSVEWRFNCQNAASSSDLTTQHV